MHILFTAIYYLMFFYLYASVFIILIAFFKGRNLIQKPIVGKRFFTYFFYIGCLVGLTAFFEAGFERALFFIPAHWGFWDDDHEWTSTKFSISIALALLASFQLMGYLEKINSKKEKN